MPVTPFGHVPNKKIRKKKIRPSIFFFRMAHAGLMADKLTKTGLHNIRKQPTGWGKME
jgi:hypothetical protein